jgi:hypothetical protein
MNKTPNTLRRPAVYKDLETGETYEEVLEVKLSDIKWVFKVVKSHLWCGHCQTVEEAIEKEFPKSVPGTRYDEELKVKSLEYCKKHINK